MPKIFTNRNLERMKAKKKLPENTYTPPLAVDDAVRKSWFTTYNIDLVNRIRSIKHATS
jgi:hypothetical protein